MNESALWQFSIKFYAQPGVADACLQLQDRFGVDVNVMLFLLFLASRGRSINQADMVLIERTVADWRSAIVAPLREVRRKLRQPVGAFGLSATAALRSDVKRIELAAECIQQHIMEQLIPLESAAVESAQAVAQAHANLALYQRQIGSFAVEPAAVIMDAFRRFVGRAGHA